MLLHDVDSLHDSRQRKGWWRPDGPPCRDNLRIVWCDAREARRDRIRRRTAGRKQTGRLCEWRLLACFQPAGRTVLSGAMVDDELEEGVEDKRQNCQGQRSFIYAMTKNGKEFPRASRPESRPHAEARPVHLPLRIICVSAANISFLRLSLAADTPSLLLEDPSPLRHCHGMP